MERRTAWGSVAAAATMLIMGCGSAKNGAGAGGDDTGGGTGTSTGEGAAGGASTTSSAGTGNASTTSSAGTGGASVVVGSDGCGKAVASGFTCFDEPFQGDTRHWCIAVPEGYTPDKPRSLVLGLHGCGGSAEGPHKGALPEQEAYGAADFLFAYPKSLGGCWQDSPTDLPFVAYVVEQVRARYCVDASRIFTEGMSSGGEMTAAVANMAHMTGLDWKVRASAGISLAGHPAQALPAWLYGGTMDSYFASYIVPERNEYLAMNGCSMNTMPLAGSTGPCVEYLGCAARTIWCSDDRGHVWPTEEWATHGILDFFRSQ